MRTLDSDKKKIEKFTLSRYLKFLVLQSIPSLLVDLAKVWEPIAGFRTFFYSVTLKRF